MTRKTKRVNKFNIRMSDGILWEIDPETVMPNDEEFYDCFLKGGSEYV